mmetsp:Transcript_11815/g.49614  ORF Transcript_11815/g.49614 Transcript_11815/m.49614 type:complete len:488 (+) Transcript_11815:2550-4013(+)
MALCVRVAAALGDGDGWRPTRVCELGSGTGAAGLLVARMLTAKRNAKTRPLVLLTDRDTAALEVITSNVRLNARGWARCVPQRLQWDRRDERSRATRRAADDDRSSSGVFPPAPFDLVLASDVLRGSRVDDARHLLDTATELLSGARRGARLVLSHPVSDAVSFAAKSSARGVKTELTHLDFVDDEHGDVGADEGDDDALDAFVAAARARGFAVREHPETETESREPKPKPFFAKKPRVRTFDVYLPGACPGAHLAGYVDVAARRAVELEREEDRGLRDLMRERYARGWTLPPSPPVATMEPPARSSSSSRGSGDTARQSPGRCGGSPSPRTSAAAISTCRTSASASGAVSGVLTSTVATAGRRSVNARADDDDELAVSLDDRRSRGGIAAAASSARSSSRAASHSSRTLASTSQTGRSSLGLGLGLGFSPTPSGASTTRTTTRHGSAHARDSDWWWALVAGPTVRPSARHSRSSHGSSVASYPVGC